LRLFSFGATIRPSAPANMPISVIASQFYLTLQNSEQSFGPMIVRPGHVFAQSDSGGPPLPPPLPPPTASTEGRVNLGLYGGYALDMAYDEVNDVMLAAVAAPQSLFMSTDSGVTWSAVFPIDSLEFVTDNVTRGFGGRGMQVEASQGYCYSRTSQEAGTLTGAQVSEDGQNWRTLLDAYLIRELVKDRYPGAHDGPRAVNVMSSNGPIALVASENFVFRTADAGQTWSISVVPDTTALNAMTSVNLLCLRRGEANENSFYTILGGDPFNPVGRLFRTENGVDFTQLHIISGADTAKVIVDVVSHPTNSDTLWVATADMTPGLNGLWRSYDAGNTWSQLSLPAGHGMGIKLKLYQETALPGTDNIRLVAVGENRYSDDLGDNWTDFSPTDDPFVDRVSSANAGLGHIPNTDIYFGQGDASPSRSSNGLGGTYYFVPTGIEGITIWKIAQIPNEPDKVYLATSAGLAYTSSFTDTNVVSTAKWASPYGNYPINPVGGGNLGFTAIAINPDNTSHIVAANGNALFVSTNGGFTNNDWTSIAYHDVPGLDEQKFKSSGGRVSAFTFLNSDSIFAAAYCENIVYGALLLSEDGGNSWKALPQAGDHVFKAIIVAKTGTPNSEVLFASGGGVSDDPGGHASKIDTGAVYKSLDRGATWSRTSYGPQAVFNPAPFPLPVNDIVAKPGSVDTLYLACGENLSNAIAYTYDGGSTLHTISMQAIGAREGAFEAVAINKHHPDSIYFAIRRDILVYDALLDSATTLFRGYPGELTHALLYDDLTMGSSAGFFEITAPSNTPTTAIDERASQQPLQMELTQNYPNPFNPSTRIIFTLSQQSKVKLEVFNLLGQRVALLLSENLAAGKHEILWKPTKLTSGVYFYRLQATEKTGRTMAITKKLMLVR
ncbi:MAG: T9SS type A sorting domain-containing protein, partial [Methyloligellaceae bacterium]